MNYERAAEEWIAERDRLREALSEVRGQLSLGPDGDEARRIIDALSRTEADG